MSRFHAQASGLVQGVGFRVWARLQAAQLGLKGYVRNLPDRSVEVVASGDEDALNTMLGLLETGPPGANVTSLDVVRFDESGSSDADRSLAAAFEIRY